MKRTIFLILITFSFQYLYSQSAGLTGLSFLKIGVGARNIALGDNGTTFSNDATAIFYNPANLATMKGNEIFIMHNSWIQDVSAEALAVKFDLWGLPLGIGLNSTSVSDIPERTVAGDKIGSFDAHYFSGALATGFQITDNLNAGFAFKFLYENMFSDEAQGYGFDFGFTYNEIIPNLSAAAALKNLGSMTELRNQTSKLPTELRVGALYAIPAYHELFSSKVSVEYQKYTELTDSHINFGVETIYNSMFALRLGYMTQYEAKGFTAGIGFKWNIVNVDYAFTPFKYDLGSTQTVSIRAAL